MTYQPLVPASAPDETVLKGNPWSQPITLPTVDSADNPIDWSGSTFTVSCEQTTITLTVVSPTSLLLSLTGVQTAALAVRFFHWYLADDVVMADMFLTGRVQLRDVQ